MLLLVIVLEARLGASEARRGTSEARRAVHTARNANRNATTVSIHLWWCNGLLREKLRRQRLYWQLHIVYPRLGGEHSLSLITVPFSFAVFLVGVLHRNLLVHQILAVHVRDGVVRRFEFGKRNESVALGQVCIISSNLN
jgi:hypothetical protein